MPFVAPGKLGLPWGGVAGFAQLTAVLLAEPLVPSAELGPRCTYIMGASARG